VHLVVLRRRSPSRFANASEPANLDLAATCLVRCWASLHQTLEVGCLAFASLAGFDTAAVALTYFDCFDIDCNYIGLGGLNSVFSSYFDYFTIMVLLY